MLRTTQKISPGILRGFSYQCMWCGWMWVYLVQPVDPWIPPGLDLLLQPRPQPLAGPGSLHAALQAPRVRAPGVQARCSSGCAGVVAVLRSYDEITGNTGTPHTPRPPKNDILPINNLLTARYNLSPPPLLTSSIYRKFSMLLNMPTWS